ncbi:hypothetical protein [Streptacidiphilus cavernicola]|uniref:Restriction endonuclease n=1 Tax=Streptacidiphilus cavernicola TaxID=3342716 RepID=A0ABV6W5B7_9ACTN
MWGKNRFRNADGAKLLSGDGTSFEMNVSIPTDPDGYFGRQCPDCSRMFRIDGEDYDALPDSLRLWCVYCGHHEDHSEFLTAQQLARTERAVGDIAVQMVERALGNAFRSLARSRPGGAISVRVTSKVTPFIPQPLPGIDEERLVRIRQCAAVGCAVRYAVFGEHRFCPVCGLLAPISIALDALDAQSVLLDALGQLPSTQAAVLREQGVFDRARVDVLKNVVGVVETLSGAVFRGAAPNPEAFLKGKGNIFQRLEDTADLFAAAGLGDVRTVVGSATWHRLLQAWAARHVHTHLDGMVDAKYLAQVPSSTMQVGQRLPVPEQLSRQAIVDARLLCTELAALVP